MLNIFLARVLIFTLYRVLEFFHFNQMSHPLSGGANFISLTFLTQTAGSSNVSFHNCMSFAHLTSCYESHTFKTNVCVYT